MLGSRHIDPRTTKYVQQVKEFIAEPAGGCSSHPMALREPGAGEYILSINNSKSAIGAIQITHLVGPKNANGSNVILGKRGPLPATRAQNAPQHCH